ncbi:MAG: NADPH:quinone oxidoreductase family protein [Candidatus Binatia bacterium]|nr:NADPH:quinone oxidoreductase family protein [Candidatus Binatia bacterium]
MYAMVVRHYGESVILERVELPDPEVAPGCVLIDVKAIGCNFADTLIVEGKYQLKPSPPFSPGSEVAGIVRTVGEGVRNLHPGQRVMALLDWGGYASVVRVPAGFVVPIPDSMPFEIGAAFGVAYQTAYLALTRRAALRPRETLLVHAAAGGVGLAAVQVGRALGARVLGTAGTAEKCELAKRHGAEACFSSVSHDWVDSVKAATNERGADVIYDPVGGDTFDRSLKCIAWCGRLLVIGFASGRIPTVAANRILLKNISVIGLNLGAYKQYEPETLIQSLQELFGLFERGLLRPEISAQISLERANEALASLRQGKTVGKIVLVP